jgi:hypothetical protein
VQRRDGWPYQPHLHGFMAHTSIKRQGMKMDAEALEIVTCPSPASDGAIPGHRREFGTHREKPRHYALRKTPPASVRRAPAIAVDESYGGERNGRVVMIGFSRSVTHD